jgi:hypothetical protein
MSNYTIASKNQLAKLLATENLTIEHKQVSTASFDMKSRVLTCPIWKDMTSELYDLFMGHEVGHALDTPLEGWHDSVSTKGANYKHFLNVVEDARIEKKIKRRYPGIKRSFITAYNRLCDDGFFGQMFNINKMSLIDKINIHFKCGISAGVNFTDDEMVFVNRIENCEVWSDVVSITDDLFAYCKGEQKKMKEDQEQKWVKVPSAEPGDAESDFEDEESEDGADGDADGEAGDESEDEADDEESGDINHEKESADSDSDQFEPECKTDKEFRKNELSLLDEKCLPYYYIKLPQVNLEHVITPQFRVHDLMNDHFRSRNKTNKAEELKKFKQKNDNYVNLMVKEFEMRKAASAYSKRKVSATGDIDINKIYKYQLEDTIFRKITKVPKGKSHGLVLLLDRSGSMSHNFNGAIEQIMVLAMFCRKVNIPFVVYGFGNCTRGRALDFPGETGRKSFPIEEGALAMTDVSLREYLNSEMRNSEFINAMGNLALLKGKYESHYEIPPSEGLSNTPLTQAIIALKPIVEKFRNTRKLDIVNLAIVHDGDADYCNRFISNNVSIAMSREQGNYYLVDKKHKINEYIDFTLHGNDAIRTSIFNWFTKTTGVKVFGFFIVPDSAGRIKTEIVRRYYVNGVKYSKIHSKNRWDEYRIRSIPETDILRQKMRADKVLVSSNPGYAKFFFILGGKSLETNFDEMVVEDGASVRKLKSAFTKMYTKRKSNRVLVNQFIGDIAV